MGLSVCSSVRPSHFCSFRVICRQTAQGINPKLGGYIDYGTPRGWLTFGRTPLNSRRFLASKFPFRRLTSFLWQLPVHQWRKFRENNSSEFLGNVCSVYCIPATMNHIRVKHAFKRTRFLKQDTAHKFIRGTKIMHYKESGPRSWNIKVHLIQIRSYLMG